MADSDEIPEATPSALAAYCQRPTRRATDPYELFQRYGALDRARIDPRLWRYDSGGGYTEAVIAAAAVAKCTTQGFDVDDLLARAAAFPRPELRRIHEAGYTETMLQCRKCGAWWRESQPEAHKPGC